VTVSLTGARFRRLAALAVVGVLAATLTACGGDDNKSDSAGGTNNTGGGTTDDYQVKLGYFPNLTHASAIIGVQKGYFEDELAKNGASLKTFQFNSGSDTIEALLGGSLDATYIGPSPTVTAYAQSQGGVQVISGATSGGASFVVSSDITSPDDLAGKTFATPGLANTQDIAFKYWLKKQGYKVSPDGTGDVTVLNQDNSETVTAFATGDIDGAWVPEPYATQLVNEGGTKLLDEKDLWPGGQFVTTQLIARTDFIKDHPDLVNDLLAAQIKANDYIAQNADAAKQEVGSFIADVTQTPIPAKVLDPAWAELTFTNDPIADSLVESKDHAVDVGLIDDTDLADLYNLDPLNALLTAAGQQEVSGPSS
jgi:NitT/TauT family transport system substrate-binding protein